MVNALSSLGLLALGTFLVQHLPSSQAQACPPFPPNLPISGPLAGTAAITAAIQNITGFIDAILAEGLISDNDTSFSVDIYSLHDGGSLFTYHHSAPNLKNAKEGATSVDSNSIYRIGSISKVFTVYTYLASSGDITWNEPVTKYVPELAKAASATQDDSDLDAVRWDDVTLGSLASHLAGVIRDVQGNLPSSLSILGLPPVPPTNGSYCGSTPQFQFPCDRAFLLESITARHPVVAPFHAPIYSNLAFQLLAFALENITSTPFAELVNATLADIPLNSTYFHLPPSSDNAVISINDTASWYSTDLGPLGPGGSFYSTINDLRTFGLSILNHTILSPALTRRWLKPHSFLPDAYAIIGAPWEIFSFPADDRYGTRVYSKSGAVGLYGSEMALVPDYGVGFTILTVGQAASVISNVGSDLVASRLVAGARAAAREQAEQLYAGTYADEATNSTIALSVVENPRGGPSLHVDTWISNGLDAKALFALLLGVDSSVLQLDFTLFPTGLAGPGPNGTRIVSWRALYGLVPPESADNSTAPPENPLLPSSSSSSSNSILDSVLGPFTLGCSGWAAVDALSYGGIAFDEVAFALDPQSGQVLSVELRVLRSEPLEKVRSGSGGGNSTVLLKRAENLQVKMIKRSASASPFVL